MSHSYQKISSGKNLWRLVPFTCCSIFGETIKNNKSIRLVVRFICQKCVSSLPCCNCCHEYKNCSVQQLWVWGIVVRHPAGKCDISSPERPERPWGAHSHHFLRVKKPVCAANHIYLMPELIMCGVIAPYINISIYFMACAGRIPPLPFSICGNVYDLSFYKTSHAYFWQFINFLLQNLKLNIDYLRT